MAGAAQVSGTVQLDVVRCGGSDAVLEAEFLASPELGLSVWQEPREYDAVTCMFALHYFFASEKTLHTFLSNVARNLKPGPCVKVLGFMVGFRQRSAV